MAMAEAAANEQEAAQTFATSRASSVIGERSFLVRNLEEAAGYL